MSIFCEKKHLLKGFFFFFSNKTRAIYFLQVDHWPGRLVWEDTLPLDFRNFPELHGDISAIQKEANGDFRGRSDSDGKKEGSEPQRLCCQVLKYKKIRWCLGFVGFPDIFARAVALENCITFISFCGLQPLVVRKAAFCAFLRFWLDGFKPLLLNEMSSSFRNFVTRILSLLSQPKPLFGNKTCSHPLGGVNHSWWQNNSLFPKPNFQTSFQQQCCIWDIGFLWSHGSVFTQPKVLDTVLQNRACFSCRWWGIQCTIQRECW